VAWSTAQITEFAQTQSNDQQEQLAIVDRLEKIRAGMLARYDFSPKKAMSNGQLFDRMTALVKTLSDAKQHELTKTFNYFDLKDACSDRGFNDDQSRVAAHLCELESRISSIRGYAGTGKSTVMRFVNEKLTEKGLRLLGVSPTGLGADGLQKSSGIPSDTVHKFLAQLLRGDVTLTPQHVVVVDEAWMVDDRLLLAILENVEKSGASVFCLGDPHQLSAVMPGHIANMVLTEESKAHPQLQKVIRQKDTSAVFANFTDKEFATLKSSGELDERLPAQLFDKVYALEDGQHRQELFTGEELRELRLALGYHNLREKLLNSDREAIELFGQGKGMQALSRLMAVGKINFFNGIKDKSDSFEEAQLPSKNNPIHTLINDWSAKVKEGIPLKDLAIIATTNADVNILNERARAYLVEHGLVERDGVSVDILREVDHFQADFTNTAIEHKAAATAALLALQQNSQKPGDVVDLENDNAQSNQPEQAVEPEPEAQFVNDKIQLAKNDRIVFLKNHKDLDIKNGNRGSIVEIDKEKMAVLFDGEDKARTIHFSEYKWFNHAFAFTVHKSQGQTIPYVFCYFHSYLNAKLTYVGCSRHTVDLKVYVVNAGVDQLLREDSEARRYLRDIQQYQEFKEMLQDCWSKSERSLKNDFTKPMVRTMGYKKSAYGVHDYKVNMHVNEQQKTRESEQKTQLIDMPQETKFKDRSFLGKVWGWLKAEDIKEEYFEKERLALLQEKALEKDLLDKAKEVEQKAYHDNLKAHYGTKATSYHGVEQVLGGVQQQAHDSTNLNNKLEKAFGQELKNMLQECSRQSERSLKNKFNKSMVRTMRYKKSAYGIQDNKFETRLVEQQKLREAQQKTQMLDMPKEIKFKDRSLVGKAWGWLKSDDIKEEIAEAEKLARLQEKAMLDKAKEVEQKAYRDDLKAHYGTKATSYAGAEQTLGVQQVEYTSLSNQLERTLSVKEKDNNLNKEKYNDLNKEKERISDSQQAKEAAAERDLSPEKELLRQQAIAKRHIEQERQLERAQQRELER
jgi:ATP-dependent exoDNAse (exonuclease V) alpha subunit